METTKVHKDKTYTKFDHEGYLIKKVFAYYPDADNWEFKYNEKAGVLFGLAHIELEIQAGDFKREYPQARFWKIAMGDFHPLYSDGDVTDLESIGTPGYDLEAVEKETIKSLVLHLKDLIVSTI
ncbi:hypothetical protein CMI37_36985 [Candidatus Pacearchaeota archaeon]|nr:hypothetical protein [Candidatus Pacearchaeota archaeon]|tara:strand:- start:10 stop:381 length:372 start_codon:yes stop_codon:yes gene_type:complete